MGRFMLPMASAIPADLDRFFATTVALITTHSSVGDNVMAAEWTFNTSYDPLHISVLVGPRHATHAAIVESGEFGVNLASDEQFALCSFAGGFSHREAHKLTSGAIVTRPGDAIKAKMIEGSLAQIECRVVATFKAGDHTEFVGEAVAARTDVTKSPVILYRGYHRLGDKIPRGREMFVALTPEGDSATRVDGMYYADTREGQRVELEAFDAAGVRVAAGEAVTDRGGYFEWSVPAPGVRRALARAGELQGEARR